MNTSVTPLKTEQAAASNQQARGANLRSALVKLHRYFGLAIAVFLIVAGVTGSIIAFSHEIDAWLNPDLFTSRSAGHPRDAAFLASRVETQFPRARPSFIPLVSAPGEAVRLNVVGKTNPDTGKPYKLAFNQVFVDPMSGDVLGTRQSGAFKLDRRHFIPFVTRLHYTLHLPKNLGTWLFGMAALVWLVDCFVGLYLTFPRGRPFMEKWRTSWQIKRKRFNFDLHRAGGLWLWIALVPLPLSSVYLNLNDEVLKPVVELFSSVTPTPLEQRLNDANRAMVKLDYEWAVDVARAAGIKRRIEAPAGAIAHRPERGVFFAIYRTEQNPAGPGLGDTRIYFDDSTGKIIGQRVPGEGTAGDIFMQVQFPLHSGQIAGLPGRIFICIAGLVVATLSVTGLVIWSRKRRARNTSDARAANDRVSGSHSNPQPIHLA